MKIVFGLLFFLFTTISFAQYNLDKNDFFEMEAFTGTFERDGFELIEGNNIRSEISSSVNSYGLNIKYGKAFLPFAHLVFGGGFAIREEATVLLFEELPNSANIVSISNQKMNSFHLDLGPRFRIINLEKFEWSLGGGGFARLTPASENDQLAGYYVQSVFGLNFSSRIQLNARYGYEKVAIGDQNFSFPLGLAFHYKIY